MLRPKLACVAFVTLLAFNWIHAERRPFTVRDSIELTTFNEPSEDLHDTKPRFSPDGKHFLIVTSRGIVDTDQIESTLWIYEATSVRSFLEKGDDSRELAPRRLVTVLTSPVAYTLDTYGSLITEPRWSADSRRVYFLRQNTSGDRQLYEVDRQTGAARQLTPPGYDASMFAEAAGKSVALISRPMRDEGETARFFGDEINKNATAVTGLSLSTILFPDTPARWQNPLQTKLWVTKEGRPGHLLHLDGSQQIDFGVIDLLSISPTGRWMVRLLPVKSVPPDWANYEPGPTFSYVRIKPEDPFTTSVTNLMRLKSYALIDLRMGKTVFRVDGPNARPLGLGVDDQAVWSPDETRVLLTNTYLPRNGVTEDVQEQRLRPCVVLDMELPSRELRCIAFSRFPDSGARAPLLRDVSFGHSKDEVILRYFGSRIERYQLSGEHWLPENPSTDQTDPGQSPVPDASESAGLEVTIHQSLNSSPVLWAQDSTTGKTGRLWDPNPQLSNMKLGDASVYRWKDRNGIEWKGGLIKPVDYIPGQRYPLVIQTHGFSDNVFKDVTDGAYPTAMAARPLASAGIMVLQIPDNHAKDDITVGEAERHVEGFRSAIAQLTSDGLIDPKHVGVVGFSRTCWYVETALIEHPTMFAAATIADGIDMSYMQFHLFFQRDQMGEFEKINQAKPFGDGLKKWIELAPGFHLDKVKTPLRIEALGQRSILGEWEIYSSLRVLGTPVDLIYIPRGQHILQKPLDRLASQQGNVDWFHFWLAGDEPHEPNRQIEFRRWEAMRDTKPISPSNAPTAH